MSRPSAGDRVASTLADFAICILVGAAASAQSWEARLPSATAGPVAFDSARGRMVMFEDAGDPTAGATWEYDGTSWQRMRPVNSPPPRGGHSLCFDPSAQRCVLFGGGLGPQGTPSDETWSYDGVTWTQVRTVGPSPRVAHSTCHDPLRQRVVLFGGLGSGPGGLIILDDTWEFDGSRWTQVLTPVSPPGGGSTLSYDLLRGRTVLVRATGNTAETWEFDGTNWSRVATSTSPPSVLGSTLAYDLARRRTVLFGGSLVSSTTPAAQDDTWEYDGRSWTRVVASVRPGPRYNAAAAYDPLRGRIVMFGGVTGYERLTDTWEFDGAVWSQIASASPPAPRSYPLIAYDTSRQRTILLGGFGRSSWLDETWAYDGARWQQLQPRTRTPSPGQCAIVYDSFRRRIVYFGTGATTCEFDGSDWICTQRPGPPSLIGHGLAYDFDRRRVVLFGGYIPLGNPQPQNGTWEYDGQSWRSVPMAVPPVARAFHGMTYDGVRHRVVAFGGTVSSASTNDTLIYDGAAWVTVQPPQSPPGTITPVALVFDSLRGVVVMPGPETWEWNGTTWTRRAVGTWPGTLSFGAAFDPGRGRVVAFGGELPSSGIRTSGTWELEPPAVATATSYGNGCSIATSAASLAVANGGVPALGSTISCSVQGLPARPGAVVLAFGFRLDHWLGAPLPQELPWIGAGCSLWIAPQTGASWFLGHGGGSVPFSLRIPADPRLAGVVLGMQGLVVDPGGAQLIDGVTNAVVLRAF